MDTSIKKFTRTKIACFSAYFTMSSAFVLPPLLFVTLRQAYSLSYAMLGLLVVVNFCTQLLIDLIFSFFSHKFNIKIAIRIMPLFTMAGLLIFSLVPLLFPSLAYVGLIVGTIVFSFAAGLNEVLISPTVSALPNGNAKRNLSFLHSLYGIGVFTVIAISTAYFSIFGIENWHYLGLFFAFLPLISSVLFFISPIPDLNGESKTMASEKPKNRAMGLALCFLCIFFGSCAECAMTNWISTYAEVSLGINKSVGDILGMAMFAIILAIVRIVYAIKGKNIVKTILIGMIGATGCYLIAGLVPNAIIAFIACVLTGMFTSMLWPGTLIMMEEKIPSPSVSAYALMAAGGDLGASIAPELMGVVVDGVSASSFASNIGLSLGTSAEQVGLKAGMIFSSIFPIIGIVIVLILIKFFKKNQYKNPQLLLKNN